MQDCFFKTEGEQVMNKYDTCHRTTRYSTEVVVDARSIELLEVTAGAETAKEKAA